MVEINLRTTELRGAGVAQLVFLSGVEGFGVSLMNPDGQWPADNYLIWRLPLATFDAVLEVLRDPPVSLYVFMNDGNLQCSLGGSRKIQATTG